MLPFTTSSTPAEPRFEFLFEIKLEFGRMSAIQNMPSGAGRGAVYIASGVISGPYLNGRVIPDSGGDWSLFRPDGVLAFDARYLLEANDGALILMHNRGYLTPRQPDTLERIQAWMFRGGPEVPFEDYYLRTSPTFEASSGPYDWLTRCVVIGVGTRQPKGNTIRYFAVL